MPVIRCTQKLLAEIGAVPSFEELESCESPLDEWYANLVLLNRQKCIVFINPTTLFVAIAYGQRRSELRQFTQVFINSLRQALVAENVEETVIDRVIQRFDKIQIAKTQDRKTLGCLNDVIHHFKWFDEQELSTSETKATTVVKKLNRIPWVKTSFGYALIPMQQILQETVGWTGQFDHF